jgi:hypothetical protein
MVLAQRWTSIQARSAWRWIVYTEKEFVSRVERARDRRVRTVALTEKGREMFLPLFRRHKVAFVATPPTACLTVGKPPLQGFAEANGGWFHQSVLRSVQLHSGPAERSMEC